jgi:hypothetical protein
MSKTNSFSVISITAVEYLHSKQAATPNEAWDKAVISKYGSTAWQRTKGCPRVAFLGLCEEGLVNGIQADVYIKKTDALNKKYALDAVELIRKNPQYLNWPITKLWKEIADKTDNNQLSVVIALIKKGFIKLDIDKK